MLGMLLSKFLYLIPLAAVIFFIISLCNFIEAKKHYKTEPNEANKEKKNTTKTILITASVIMGVLLAVVIGFVVLMYTAIAYM
ncbi:MAG: hypothetical protein IJZ55_07030 [Lachnospiraceae bacterium]|nr:hypothetical protein [Lachnospiraceae bacterium]